MVRTGRQGVPDCLHVQGGCSSGEAADSEGVESLLPACWIALRVIRHVTRDYAIPKACGKPDLIAL